MASRDSYDTVIAPLMQRTAISNPAVWRQGYRQLRQPVGLSTDDIARSFDQGAHLH